MKHQWVAITIVPVTEVALHADPNQPPTVTAAEPDKEDTQYGCSHCSEPLTSKNLEAECKGDG